ncbi:MAG TPA: LPS assembly protein LptD [Steroidobacteraceae bacterium]|nr:LPS assembly protein LptD [Steroidobacteraceae bacterium]
MQAPGPEKSIRERARRSTLPIATIAAIAACLTGNAAAAEDENSCPAPVRASGTARPAAHEQPQPGLTDAPIEYEADGVEATRDGQYLLQGDVLLTQGERTLKTRNARYNTQEQRIDVDENVEYADPSLKVSGTSAEVDQVNGATFEGAQFELKDRNARGSANRIQVTRDNELKLDGVRYTTCPLGREDWIIRASDIDIRQRAGLGFGRGVRLDFKGVPILYTPFISFPVGNQRKSGFLFPTIGTSTRSGSSLAVPWYWNIAPNYDATFVPTWFSKRGGKLDSEFRYLENLGRGTLETEYLPDDKEFGDSRHYVHFVDRSDLTDTLRLDIDAANVGDSQWFEDFGLGPEGTSISYLERTASLTYLTQHWLAVLRAQNFQTIDDIGIPPELRPHTLRPQLAVHAGFPNQFAGLEFGLDMEVGDFVHNYADLVTTGWRMDVAPEVRLPLRGAGMYLEPAASWRYTAYRLDDTSPRPDGDSPSRSAPILSLDGGLVFERPTGRHGQRLQTLEPRFMYLYVPFRNQNDLPVFDTAAADLNLVQLFRTNRFVGADRLSDANQISVGVTSRLLDAEDGKQFISGTIGQTYYFEPPRVALPGEVLSANEVSDIIAELDVTAFGNWNVGMGVQYNPNETRSEKGDVQVQYKPAYDRVVNVGYRFRRGNIEQVDGSLAWPIGKDWSAYARMVYSLEDQKSLDQFAGLEYRSCCWRLRAVARRYVSDRTGDTDTSFLVQLELNGLSSVGVGADAFLERSIRGYSAGPPEP